VGRVGGGRPHARRRRRARVGVHRGDRSRREDGDLRAGAARGEHIIYDPWSGELDVYRLDASTRRYERVDPDARGLLRCEPLGLSVGVVHGVLDGADAPWLRWFDGEGNALLEPAELATREAERAGRQALREAERAEREAERAEREAGRAREAEAEIARLRAELSRREGSR